MLKTVTTWNLQMLDQSQLRPTRCLDPRMAVQQARVACPELNRFLYTAVGGDWSWMDRLPWTYAQWMEWLDRPELETWVAFIEGNPAGYFELERQPGQRRVGPVVFTNAVEIVYFGLLPQFVGRGLGGQLLTRATKRAWEMGGTRVWVHTCSNDHPHALASYQARGFEVFHVEAEDHEFPESPIGPWPGAAKRP